MGEWNSSKPKSGCDRGFLVLWNIPTGPFASLLTSFVHKMFRFSHHHKGRTGLITPEGKRGVLQTPDKNDTQVFQC